jgi:hypothetical protein
VTQARPGPGHGHGTGPQGHGPGRARAGPAGLTQLAIYNDRTDGETERGFSAAQDRGTGAATVRPVSGGLLRSGACPGELRPQPRQSSCSRPFFRLQCGQPGSHDCCSVASELSFVVMAKMIGKGQSVPRVPVSPAPLMG